MLSRVYSKRFVFRVFQLFPKTLFFKKKAQRVVYKLRAFEKLGFLAEHGGFFRERKLNEWTDLTKSLDMGWMSDVEEIFKY